MCVYGGGIIQQGTAEYSLIRISTPYIIDLAAEHNVQEILETSRGSQWIRSEQFSQRIAKMASQGGCMLERVAKIVYAPKPCAAVRSVEKYECGDVNMGAWAGSSPSTRSQNPLPASHFSTVALTK